ncbi:MAG: GntR family transcriptional regulator [Tenericutes bacterium HGW-Tenericutes-1]|jgi:GntR family transcriptional regulator|nr:MAG: GntR family transcriptional regulator [Tenericutes bacterium HGW-Tenericutes-1]PKM57014.1 MAG: GntR family transcriptional regulator [Firmicutes bacterium HGW-Firmicutes-3]
MSTGYKIPKYYVLKQDIIRKIEQDELNDDQMIPSERELTEKHGISRITVRKAIDELVNEGYLYRIQGKGTYVKGDSVKQELFSITSCTRDILQMGKIPTRKVINALVIVPNSKRMRELEITATDKIFTLDRVYCADGAPVNRTIVYLPMKLFPEINRHDFGSQSLYDVLEREYNVKITRATRTIEAIAAESKIAELLMIPEGIPILLFRGVTYGIVNGKEVPIETFKSYYRSDNRRFYINQVKVD